MSTQHACRSVSKAACSNMLHRPQCNNSVDPNAGLWQPTLVARPCLASSSLLRRSVSGTLPAPKGTDVVLAHVRLWPTCRRWTHTRIMPSRPVSDPQLPLLPAQLQLELETEPTRWSSKHASPANACARGTLTP
jgi:hypothetical protein